MQVGLNFSDRETAYDLILISKFKNVEALEAYRVHPAHQLVLKKIAGFKMQTAVVDFEI